MKTDNTTLHFVTNPKFFAREDGKLYYLPEVPIEPLKGICSEEPVPGCYENNSWCKCAPQWKPYKAALQKAKDNAIEVGNRHDVWNWIWDSTDKKDSLICGHIYTLTGNYSVEIKQSDCHTDECWLSEKCTAPYNCHSKKLAFIKQQEVEQQCLCTRNDCWQDSDGDIHCNKEQKEEETQEQATVNVMVILQRYEAGMSEYFRMHDYRNMYSLWEKLLTEIKNGIKIR